MAVVIALLLVLALVLVALRMRARRREARRRDARRRQARRRSAPDPTALVGRTALVVERIANAEAIGCVAVDGLVWTARAYDAGQEIEAGEEVEVVDVRGATALVAQQGDGTLRH